MTDCPEGFATPCEHGQRGGSEFCIFCLRARADRAELEVAHLQAVAEAAEYLLDHTPDAGLNGSPQLNGALIAWHQHLQNRKTRRYGAPL